MDLLTRELGILDVKYYLALAVHPAYLNAVNSHPPKELFLNSLRRCLEFEYFIPTFYERFLSSSDEVAEKFKGTDFRRQNRMLVKSLELAAAATSGDTDGLRELSERAKSHDRHHLDIAPKLYDLWRDTIVSTARNTDPAWDDEVEKAWNLTLDYVIKYMVRSY